MKNPPGSIYGCRKCGLIGCDCEKVALEAQTPEQARAALDKICPVCRRAAQGCICRSHVEAPEVFAETIEQRDISLRRPVSEKTLRVLELEAMHFYYNRDATGLARWIRRRFTA